MGKNERTPLHRKRRRALEREQKKRPHPKSFWEKHLKEIYAGAVLTTGGALVVGGLIFLRGQDERIPLPPTAVAQQVSTEQQTLQQSKLIIQQETNRLGIKLSTKEQELWANASFDISDKKFQINETTLNIVLERLIETGSLMQKSENPYFQHAANIISRLTDPNTDKLSIKILPELVTGDHYKKDEHAVMGIEPTIKDGKIHYVLKTSGDIILNNSNALSIALTFVHETKHLDDFIAYEQASDPTLSVEQKLASITRRLNNPKEILTDEARAYAEDSKAFIFQAGLGIKVNVQDKRVNTAANFITFGNRPDSEGWLAFIASETLSPGNDK